jgi:hypothetical protein
VWSVRKRSAIIPPARALLSLDPPQSFGAVGFHISRAEDFLPTLRRSFIIPLPVIISVDVDYSQNEELFKDVIDAERFH